MKKLIIGICISCLLFSGCIIPSVQRQTEVTGVIKDYIKDVHEDVVDWESVNRGDKE